jgi:lipoprotein-anchoring transpeptidase ErfK/SrfK
MLWQRAGMMRRFAIAILAGAALLAASDAPGTAPFDPGAVNSAQTLDTVGPQFQGPAALRAQILLGRAHFSPAEIDGRYGDNLRAALYGFQASRKLPLSGIVDAATWQALNVDTQPTLVSYTVMPQDVSGPFVDIPGRLDEQADLECTCYRNAEEELGEHFHVNPALLARMNPGKDVTKAGEEILVPNVLVDFHPPMAAAVVVSKSNAAVTAFAADGSIIAQYPATMGSEHDPLPIGMWRIARVKHNPWFYYNPKLFWNASPDDARAKIPPGPNNPVGLVWMGLTKEHYGIHGTPAPDKIGHAQSHGCIRLTNWDAVELSGIAHKGTPVNLTE